MKAEYKKRVDLLLEILPYALSDNRMALKGGTAINLFHRNFPRLSVDIDLCYLPLEDRETSYKNIHNILSNIKKSIEINLQFKVKTNYLLDGKKEAKLFVTKGKIEVKIEPNFIIRSSLFPPEIIKLAPQVQIEFEKSFEIQCLNVADTYGGKICAALDRQHPRDLFDVKYLFENEGLTPEVIDSFIYYLISHNRPIDELLNQNLKDITELFKDEFIEMSMMEVRLEELIECRDLLVKKIKSTLTKRDKKFLLSFVENRPNWALVSNSALKDYPSVKWKMKNQEKMSETSKNKYLENCSRILI